MAIRRPSDVPVSIVRSYPEMEKTFITIYNISKLEDYFMNPKLAHNTSFTNINCILIDLICQQFVNKISTNLKSEHLALYLMSQKGFIRGKFTKSLAYV